LGNLLSDLKCYKEAGAAYRKAIEINPSDATAYYNLACLECVMGNIEGSFENLEKATKLEGFDPDWAHQDPDLENIRNDPRFKELVGE
jgi:adenylate cyclase